MKSLQMLPRKGCDTHGRWGKHECCVFGVVNNSAAMVRAVPHVLPWLCHPFQGVSLLFLPAIHSVCCRNKGVKVQGMGLPPTPVKGQSKDNVCDHHAHPLHEWRSANLSLSLGLHHRK